MSKAESGWDDAVRAPRKKYAPGTLGGVLELYRASPAYRNLAASTKRTYEQAFDRLHAYGHQDIGGLRRRHILKIRDDLADTPGVANSVVTAVAAICLFALDREIIQINPAHRIPRLKLEEWRRWTPDEISRFYAETYEALRRVLVLALFTGQRRADLCRMTWSDIRDGAVRVTQQKTGARLWIPIHPTLQEHLPAWRADTTTVTILAHSDRRPWKPGILSTTWSHEARGLDMAGCTLHGLRKTAAAMLAEAGCTTKEIQSITGHATLAEIERYTREAEQRTLAGNAMAKWIGPSLKLAPKPLKRQG